MPRPTRWHDCALMYSISVCTYKIIDVQVNVQELHCYVLHVVVEACAAAVDLYRCNSVCVCTCTWLQNLMKGSQ